MIRNHIAFLAINLVNHNSWDYMKRGYRLFGGTREQMQQYQDEAYQNLLMYAYNHTKYWHRAFDEIGLIKNGQVYTERYNEIPILTKEIIRREGENLISDEADQRGKYFNTSGGSTGEPVKFVQDKRYFSCNFGDKLLFSMLNGKKPGDKEIKLWGSEKDILEGSIGVKEKCINWCYNRTFMNSFVLTPELMDKYAKTICNEKPVQIWTYADSIYQLAKYINENEIHAYSPRIIISTAGVLYDEMREEINKAFPESNLLNQYGSREVGLIGCEVGQDEGIRIFDHSVKVEILNEKNGQISDYGEGELLITNLNNYSMPLIRFRIGDLGERTPVIEGYSGSFTVLRKLIGRTNTHLKKEDGSLIHGEYVTHLFYNKDWIENFKVIQHDYRDIEFQIVLKKDYEINEKELQKMKEELGMAIGECSIKVTYLDKIPKLKSGKYQFVVSEVK